MVHQEASALGILFFVVGATARDIVLNHCHTIKTNRATRDLDIGVEVDGWDEFQQLPKGSRSQGFNALSNPSKVRFDPFEVAVNCLN